MTGPRSLRPALVLLVVSLCVAACAGAPPSASPTPAVSAPSPTGTPSASEMTGPTGSPPPSAGSPSAPPATSDFGDDDVAAAVELLARAGIAVRVGPADAALVAPSGQSRIALLRFQVRNLALEAHAGGGSLGGELDEISAANGGVPVSYLIAAWARTAGTQAAAEGVRLLGEQPGVEPPSMRIPGLVTTLFLADVLGGAVADTAQPVLAAVGQLAVEADYCEELGAYLAAVLDDVADPGLVVAPPWLQGAIDQYPLLENDPVKLRNAVAATAILIYATSISRPWVVVMSADPLDVHYIIGGDELTPPSKAVRISVDAGEGSLSEDVAACAELAGAQLADAELEGTPVGWVLDAVVKHGTDIEGDLELDERGNATLEYQTKGETSEAHEKGTLRNETMVVGAALQRQDLPALTALVEQLIAGSGGAAPNVQAVYATVKPKLDAMLHPRGAQAVAVSWHVPPSPTPSPTPTPTPRGAVWVHVERPASAPMMAGTVMEVVACDGPYGKWEGWLAVGGLDAGEGFVIPFQQLPVAFEFEGSDGTQTTTTTTSGKIASPIGSIDVAYQLQISTDGSTLGITGTGSAATGVVSVNEQIGMDLTRLPIEPAPEGRCP